MPPRPATISAYLFGRFRLNVRDCILEKDGVRVPLTPKVVDTLFVLVQNAHQVVTKEALMKAVWPDVTVVESGLTRNISVLRKALEEDLPEGSYIETIPRRGYRFVAELTEEVNKVVTDTAAPEKPNENPTNPTAQVQGVSSSASRHWIRVGIGFAVSTLITFALFRSSPTSAIRPLEPKVRIGEHLLYKLEPEQTMRAATEFEQAIASTPGSAAAHAGLSIALLQMSVIGVRSVAEVADRAEREASKALELDRDLASAHYAAALVSLLQHWELDRAERSFRRALQLDPGSVQSRVGYTQLKFARGEVTEGIRITEEALRLDPASPLLGARYCQAFYYARDYLRAEAECRKVLDREPHYMLAHYYLALSLGWLGRTDQAREVFAATAMPPGVLQVDRAWLSLRDGNRGPALEALRNVRELIPKGKVNASAKLLLCAMLGEQDEAFEAIKAAIASRAVEMLTFHIDPRLDSLRSDPRYPGVLRRIGFTPGV